MDQKEKNDHRAVVIMFLALTRLPGVGRVTAGEFVEKLRAESGGALEPGQATTGALVDRIPRRDWAWAEREVERAEASGVKILSVLHPDYPQPLRQIADPPWVLFVRGALPKTFAIGIVGARMCSAYGRRSAAEIAKQVAERRGAVISGLAIGVDTAAHQGALRGCEDASAGGSKTAGVAVLGSGVFNIYPAQNAALAEEIVANKGAVISEYGVDASPLRHHFPERNRIISGLSDAVVIVEAKSRSGALITSRLANEQGRQVFAVPGTLDSPLSAGTNELLCEGATLIRSVADIFKAVKYLEPMASQSVSQAHGVSAEQAIEKVSLESTALGKEEKALAEVVLEVLEDSRECHFDQLVEKTGILPPVLGSLLLSLELSELVFSLPGNFFSIHDYVDTR